MSGTSSKKVNLRSSSVYGGSMFLKKGAVLPEYTEPFAIQGFPNPRIVLPEHFEFASTGFSCYFTNTLNFNKRS